MGQAKFIGIPIFRILDYDIAMQFYVDFLDFKIDWEHRFGEQAPVYMQISKDGLILHLSENNRFNTGVIVFVESKDLRSFHNELIKSDPTKVSGEVTKTDWGTLQLEIEDPFCNLLRFNETVDNTALA